MQEGHSLKNSQQKAKGAEPRVSPGARATGWVDAGPWLTCLVGGGVMGDAAAARIAAHGRGGETRGLSLLPLATLWLCLPA